MILTSTMYLVECRQGKFLKDFIYHMSNIFELKNKTKKSTVESQMYEWQLMQIYVK